MQSFDIHPGQDHGYRDSPKRRDDLQRVKVIEKVSAKWKAVILVIFACAGLVLSFEVDAHGSNIHGFADALWWAITTVTTVGYGDRFPVTAGGRGVAVVLMLVAIGLIGVLTATVASYFVEQQAGEGMADLNERLDRMEAMLITLASEADSTPGVPTDGPAATATVQGRLNP
jgi:voltage-gated potassium channel